MLYLDASGTPTDPVTPDTEVSKDGAAFADCAEEVATIAGSNGAGYLTLTGAETDAALLVLAAKVASGPKATLATLTPRVLPVLESGTATAGAAGSITLAAGAAAYDLRGCIVRTTGGTGGGGTGGADNQARVITAYNPATKLATVSPNWEVTPGATTTYDILLTDAAAAGLWAGGSVLALKQLSIINSTGDALVASSTGANGRGIAALGNGTGPGMQALGGASGHGLQATGGTTLGDGARFEAIAANNDGLRANGFGTGSGLSAVGGSGAAGGRFAGQGAAAGLSCLGGTSGAGISGVGGGAAAGLLAQGGATGPGLNAIGGGTSAGVLATAGASGVGLLAQGGTTTGDGARFEARGGNNDGLELVKFGTGLPMNPAASGGTGLDAAATAAAVWGAARATYNGAATFGESVRLNATGLATDAIDADALAVDAINEIGAVLDIATQQELVDGVWNELKSAHVVPNSFGDFLDIEVSSRASVAGGGGLDPAQTAAAVWGAARATYNAANSFGESVRLNAAGLATDAVTEIQTGLPTAASVAAVQADTDNLQTRVPAALVGGRMDASVGAMGAGVVTAAAIATDAIDNDALAANAMTEIAAGVWDEPLAGHVATGTAGEAATAARAQAYGRWVIAGDALTLYGADGTTVVKQFALAPSGGPFTSRTPV